MGKLRRVSKWFWQKIEGNVYFWLLQLTFTSGLFTYAVHLIQKLRHVQQQDLMGYIILGVLFFIALANCTLLIRQSRIVREQLLEAETSKSAISQTIDALATADLVPRPVDLTGKIRELYIQSFDGMSLLSSKYILIYVHIVNRGQDEATITSCRLKISLGAWSQTAVIMNRIPNNWRVKKRRMDMIHTAYDEFEINPILKTSEIYKKGIPKNGWFALELIVDGGTEFPNAQFDFEMDDSLGGTHTIRRESGVYACTGELIQLQASPVPLTES